MKILFYSYGVSTGCCVGFSSVFSKLKDFFDLLNR